MTSFGTIELILCGDKDFKFFFPFFFFLESSFSHLRVRKDIFSQSTIKKRILCLYRTKEFI